MQPTHVCINYFKRRLLQFCYSVSSRDRWNMIRKALLFRRTSREMSGKDGFRESDSTVMWNPLSEHTLGGAVALQNQPLFNIFIILPSFIRYNTNWKIYISDKNTTIDKLINKKYSLKQQLSGSKHVWLYSPVSLHWFFFCLQQIYC